MVNLGILSENLNLFESVINSDSGSTICVAENVSAAM